jgi:hypothetical protein
MQSEGHVAGATAKVENARVWLLQDCRKTASRPTPPPTVYVERENMIEQIVPRRDGSEHFPHCARG